MSGVTRKWMFHPLGDEWVSRPHGPAEPDFAAAGAGTEFLSSNGVPVEFKLLQLFFVIKFVND